MKLFLKPRLYYLILISLLSPNVASAYYYAYIPDLSNQKLHVVNTDMHLMVEVISLIGRPRDVIINNSGSRVYVSTVGESTKNGVTTTQSYINSINTKTNKADSFLRINFDNVRGMAISKDDQFLYVTHKNGVSKIPRSFSSDDITDIPTMYRGNSMVLSNDDKYLFVLGSDDVSLSETDPSLVNYGISVIDTESLNEIYTFSLGTGKNSNHIVLDDDNKKLFIAHKDTNEIQSLSINNSNNISTFELKTVNLINLPVRSNPIALLLSTDNSELYVALSYETVDSNNNRISGTVIILDATDIKKTVSFNNTDSKVEVSLEYKKEDPTYSGATVHPAALGLSNDGRIFLIKRVWSNKAGLYISEIDEFNSRSGRSIYETQDSVFVSNSASIFSNGKFVGASCEDCPTGIDVTETHFERPAAINPLYLLYFATVAFFRRRIN